MVDSIDKDNNNVIKLEDTLKQFIQCDKVEEEYYNQISKPNLLFIVGCEEFKTNISDKDLDCNYNLKLK